MTRHTRFPADTTPTRPDKPTKSLTDQSDRMAALGIRVSADDRAAALKFLTKRGLDDVATMLGLTP